MSLELLLPERTEPYTDKYFLRSKEILEKDGINPVIRAQYFIRKGPGIIGGLEALEELHRQRTDNLRIQRLEDGTPYEPKQTLAVVEARAQDIIDLETVALGILSAQTTQASGEPKPNVTEAFQVMSEVVQAAKGKPVSYFGARHTSWHHDRAINTAAFAAGATSTSTDIGAELIGATGIGTIPHVLENIYASIYGHERAVVETTKAFDRHIDPAVPRIALIDYNNREVDDALTTAREVPTLAGVRIDTCGENVAQGALARWDEAELTNLFGFVPDVLEQERKYWVGTGVTVSGTYAVRKALNKAGHKDIQIILSSGFGNPEKVRAFVQAEEQLGHLFDALGVGGIYESRAATMDVVGVGDDFEFIKPVSKVGREYKPMEVLV